MEYHLGRIYPIYSEVKDKAVGKSNISGKMISDILAYAETFRLYKMYFSPSLTEEEILTLAVTFNDTGFRNFMIKCVQYVLDGSLDLEVF